MIGYCGALLVLAAVATSGEPVTNLSRASAASISDESGGAYRDRARTAVHDVLARREFADLHSDPYAAWRQILTWIGTLFQRLGNALKGLPPWLFWIVVAWMVLTLLAILAHLIYTLATLLRGTSRAGNNRGGRDKIAGELLGIKDLDFDKVYAEARRLLAAGDWPAATRYFYVAAILWLDRQGWIVFKRSKTNCDYIAELSRRAGVLALAGFSPQSPSTIAAQRCPGGTPTRREEGFRRLTELFEPIVYGGRPPTAAAMNDISTTVESLVNEPAVASTR